MKNLLERLQAGEILIGDGAMGTFLQAKGLKPGECPELWCVEREEDVLDVHRQYRDAGSDILECNSFGGTRYKLRHYGLADRAAEINRAAAGLARRVAGESRCVLGSAGPTGVMLEPYGDEPEAAVMEAFAEQIAALAAGGADAVIIETMVAIEEAAAGIKAARAATSLTVIGSLTFEPQAHGGYATLMGVTPERGAEALLSAGAHVVGTNCGTGPDHMIEIVRRLHAAAPGVPLLAMPNAGLPVVENGRTVFPETPEEMAEKAHRLVEAGARIIGGCCGTGPAHIAAMRRAVLSRPG